MINLHIAFVVEELIARQVFVIVGQSRACRQWNQIHYLASQLGHRNRGSSGKTGSGSDRLASRINEINRRNHVNGENSLAVWRCRNRLNIALQCAGDAAETFVISKEKRFILLRVVVMFALNNLA